MRTGPSVCSTALRWTSLRASVWTIIRRLLFAARGRRASAGTASPGALARDAQDVTPRLRDGERAREVREGRFGPHVLVDRLPFESVAASRAARDFQPLRIGSMEPCEGQFR